MVNFKLWGGFMNKIFEKHDTLFCILLICAFAGSLCGCVNERSMRKSPHYYDGSTWESEDGKLQFTIPENRGNEYTGIYKNGDISVEMVFKFGTYFGLEGCTLEDYKGAEPDKYGIKHKGGGHTPTHELDKL